MSVKYVFVTGGVVSGLGKGITAASLGRLLKARGYKVTMQKFDPYINIDPGTMNPIQHGEVFVTDDGAETDLDLGHYERFIDESLTKNSNVTTGKVYWSVLTKERRGDFGGGTVQVIPHITNEIKSRFHRSLNEETEIAIIEVGGTVGDIESQPYIEAIRQFQHDVGHENCILIHVALMVYLPASEEMKTKPIQMSVKELQRLGIQPDIVVCRTEFEIDDILKDKISLFCNVPASHVVQNLTVDMLYEAPLAMEKEHLAEIVCESLNLDCPEPDLDDWKAMVKSAKNPTKEVTVALVGKYIALHDAYISVVESLKHAGYAANASVNIKWVDSETVTDEMLLKYFGNVSEEATLWIKVEGGDWTQITSIAYPEVPQDKSFSPFETQAVSLAGYEGKKIKVGFKYVSTDEAAGTWEIRNFKVSTDVSGINEIKADKLDVNAPVYNLAGQRVKCQCQGNSHSEWQEVHQVMF